MTGKKMMPELTEKEKLAKEREHGLMMLERCLPFINEPSYIFSEGSFVKYGNMNTAVVKEVIENGKAYGLECTATASNYGNPYDYKTYVVAIWTDVRPLYSSATAFAKKNDFRLQFNNVSIDSLIHQYYHFGIDMDPDYQRGYVWNDNDRKYLIRSIFEGLDIGKFVLAKKEHGDRADGRMYEIVDGKQRLNTIIMFYENRLSYEGFYYNDLSMRDRNLFENRTVAEAEINGTDRQTILRYFLMLNTGGRVMDKEHIAKVSAMLDQEEKDQD